MLLECFLASLTLCSLSLLFLPCDAQLNDPAVFYTMLELVCSDGYHVQEHRIVTEDGYVLEVHRIPNAKRRAAVPSKTNHYQRLHSGYHPDFGRCVNESLHERPTGPPVLLAHGLFSSSDNFVLQGPKYDLAYLLVDAGYDVWFTNVRGNFYSRRHTTLTPSDPKFWDFSFHEIGYYDVPAIVDYVLDTSSHQKLTYVGHSMGTTMFFVTTSIRPEYNDKFELFVGLAPLAQIKKEHFTPQREGIFATGYKIVKAVNKRGVYEFGARTLIPVLLSRSFCGRGSPFQNLCYDFIFSVTGYHSKLFSRKKFSVYLAHGLSGGSIKTIVHYHQLFYTPTFRCFNYGREENTLRYGQPEPPDYDLRKVTTPVALYYSHHDYVVDAKDTELLLGLLPRVVEVHPLSKYSHVDFLWAYNARDLIYKKVLALMGRLLNEVGRQ